LDKKVDFSSSCNNLVHNFSKRNFTLFSIDDFNDCRMFSSKTLKGNSVFACAEMKKNILK
jgi:hypothetical protein